MWNDVDLIRKEFCSDLKRDGGNSWISVVCNDGFNKFLSLSQKLETIQLEPFRWSYLLSGQHKILDCNVSLHELFLAQNKTNLIPFVCSSFIRLKSFSTLDIQNTSFLFSRSFGRINLSISIVFDFSFSDFSVNEFFLDL